MKIEFLKGQLQRRVQTLYFSWKKTMKKKLQEEKEKMEKYSFKISMSLYQKYSPPTFLRTFLIFGYVVVEGGPVFAIK